MFYKWKQIEEFIHKEFKDDISMKNVWINKPYK